MLPSWITAVKATPGSPQPSNTGTTLRWAVLLIGRNSVSPWTNPSTMACQHDCARDREPVVAMIGMPSGPETDKPYGGRSHGDRGGSH